MWHMFKVIRSNAEIALTQPRLLLDFTQLRFRTEFDYVTADTLQTFKVKRSKVKGHGKTSVKNAVKRYKTAKNRLSDFLLGMGVSSKSENDWAASSCNASQLPLSSYYCNHYKLVGLG